MEKLPRRPAPGLTFSGRGTKTTSHFAVAIRGVHLTDDGGGHARIRLERVGHASGKLAAGEAPIQIKPVYAGTDVVAYDEGANEITSDCCAGAGGAGGLEICCGYRRW